MPTVPSDLTASLPGRPPVVDLATWQAARDELLLREKAHTREGDAIAAARRLANLIEGVGGEFAVATGVDLRLRDVPLLNRRPDVVVFDASLPDSEVLRPSHCALVIEVMSPGSVTTDQVDKPAEYAAAGIRHFWRVEQDVDTGEVTVFRYRLSQGQRTYASPEVSAGVLSVAEPFGISIDLADLLRSG